MRMDRLATGDLVVLSSVTHGLLFGEAICIFAGPSFSSDQRFDFIVLFDDDMCRLFNGRHRVMTLFDEGIDVRMLLPFKDAL